MGAEVPVLVTINVLTPNQHDKDKLTSTLDWDMIYVHKDAVRLIERSADTLWQIHVVVGSEIKIFKTEHKAVIDLLKIIGEFN